MAKIFYKESEIRIVEYSKYQRFEDLKGKKFCRLTVIGYAGKSNGNQRCWFCKCDCGNITKVQSGSLKSNNSKSCGCLKSITRKYPTSRSSPMYATWNNMLQRCQNPKYHRFKDYGGRGIKVCERWQKFENFLDDMGEKPSKDYSLERNDNNKGYSKENCRWATRIEQGSNKRNNIFLTIEGRTQTVTQWEKECGMTKNTIYKRLKRNWPIDKAILITRQTKKPK